MGRASRGGRRRRARNGRPGIRTAGMGPRSAALDAGTDTRPRMGCTAVQRDRKAAPARIARRTECPRPAAKGDPMILKEDENLVTLREVVRDFLDEGDITAAPEGQPRWDPARWARACKEL